MLVLSVARDVSKINSISDLQNVAITSLFQNINKLLANIYSLSNNEFFRWHDLSGHDLIIQDPYFPLAITQDGITSLLSSSPASIFVNSHILSIYSLEKIFIASSVIPFQTSQYFDYSMFPLYANRSVLNKFLSQVSKDTTSNLSIFHKSFLKYLLRAYPLQDLVSSTHRFLNITYPMQLNPPSASLQRQDRSLSISNELFQSIFPSMLIIFAPHPFLLTAIRY